jgi:VanZ family protein
MSFLKPVDSREAYNEKIKLLAHTLQNFAVAATIAMFGRMFTVGADLLIAVSAIVAISLFATAYNILGFLERDER